MALTQVKTTGLADDAVTLAKQAAGTDGQIITYDASGNPTAVGPGTDGQVLTSTGAGSPPAFEDASAGAALTGSTNNTVVTVTGANAMAGEATFTYNGSDTLKVAPAGASPAVFIGESDRTTADQQLAEFSGHWDGTAVARMLFHVGADTTNKDEGRITFQTAAPGGTLTERLRIDETGSVKVTDGDLVIGTSGHGIDFAATGQASGNTQELFDDYEEGTWTPDLYHQGSSNNAGFYTKIGRMVYAHFKLTAVSAVGNANHQRIVSLPFTIKDSNPCGSAARGYQTYNSQGGPLYSLSSNSTEVYLYTNTGTAIEAADLGTTTLTGTFIYMTDS